MKYVWEYIIGNYFAEYNLFRVYEINVSIQRCSRRETLASKRLSLAHSRVLR